MILVKFGPPPSGMIGPLGTKRRGLSLQSELKFKSFTFAPTRRCDGGGRLLFRAGAVDKCVSQAELQFILESSAFFLSLRVRDQVNRLRPLVRLTA